MRTFRQMEAVVEQYNRNLAQWERQTGKTGSPPEKESIREKTPTASAAASNKNTLGKVL